MKHFHQIILLVLVSLLLIPQIAGAKESPPGDAPELVIADFDSGKKPNNVGGDFGSWNYAPRDETQGCWDWFEPTNFNDVEGYSVIMEYDVKSPNPAFCGLWMKLKNVDVSPYDVLSLWLKGDEKTGFTTRFKIEMRNKRGKRAVYTVSGVDNTWQNFKIPFKKTRAINDWSQIQEMTVVFDDIMATKKVGQILLDQISFRKYTPEELKAQKEALAKNAAA